LEVAITSEGEGTCFCGMVLNFSSFFGFIGLVGLAKKHKSGSS
jgi:hypothetical protein